MWTLVPAVVVSTQDLFFIAAQIQLPVVLVHSQIPMEIRIRVTSTI